MITQKLSKGTLLFLPLPPSTNARTTPVWTGGYVREILTKEARQYIAQVGAALALWRKSVKREAIGYYQIVDVWMILPRTSADNHNYFKCLMDALEAGGVVENDKFLLPRVMGIWHDRAAEVIIKI